MRAAAVFEQMHQTAVKNVDLTRRCVKNRDGTKGILDLFVTQKVDGRPGWIADAALLHI